MKVEYKIETVDKSINTTAVEIVVEERTFNQMWKEVLIDFTRTSLRTIKICFYYL